MVPGCRMCPFILYNITLQQPKEWVQYPARTPHSHAECRGKTVCCWLNTLTREGVSLLLTPTTCSTCETDIGGSQEGAGDPRACATCSSALVRVPVTALSRCGHQRQPPQCQATYPGSRLPATRAWNSVRSALALLQPQLMAGEPVEYRLFYTLLPLSTLCSSTQLASSSKCWSVKTHKTQTFSDVW